MDKKNKNVKCSIERKDGILGFLFAIDMRYNFKR